VCVCVCVCVCACVCHTFSHKHRGCTIGHARFVVGSFPLIWRDVKGFAVSHNLGLFIWRPGDPGVCLVEF